ncbi:hypothetical protein G647_02525 [Cladophialophora carrionii CBS 160.54]|uniref:Uncharacterized protein n=1 Tax=Cladophialophora carrionii CBS 160.54 TaxID=1279043 RepID=V9DGD4_9EURO|nr:uncharacterized protein G647_02525 [Cladophialophora carrionii CBS 160.54]ETI25751.1 hypothetical protein G647_02525 [Cladophialophora carrionii CBS 160.54]
MLRRKPTALTITAEDIASFEEAHARRLAYLRYKKTGDDPEGLFRNGAGPELQQQSATESQVSGEQQQQHHQAAAAAVDPNDELKPLPGDKARIVRGREERIMGPGSAR